LQHILSAFIEISFRIAKTNCNILIYTNLKLVICLIEDLVAMQKNAYHFFIGFPFSFCSKRLSQEIYHGNSRAAGPGTD
jgi:hypothetical protein